MILKLRDSRIAALEKKKQEDSLNEGSCDDVVSNMSSFIHYFIWFIYCPLENVTRRNQSIEVTTWSSSWSDKICYGELCIKRYMCYTLYLMYLAVLIMHLSLQIMYPFILSFIHSSIVFYSWIEAITRRHCWCFRGNKNWVITFASVHTSTWETSTWIIEERGPTLRALYLC